MTDAAEIVAFVRARLDDDERKVAAMEREAERVRTAPIFQGYPPNWLAGVDIFVSPKRWQAEVAAKRQIVDDWQREVDQRNAIYDQPDTVLHAHRMHPDWEYATTEGPRKTWDHSDKPPNGDGWVRNTTAYDDEGWERFEYTEESYWRRLRSEGQRGCKDVAVPRHILLLALPHAGHPDYREDWRP